MQQELPEHLKGEVLDLSSMASDDKLAKARQLAVEFVLLDRQIESSKQALKELEARKLEIASKELPEFFDSINTDLVGVPEAGVDVKVGPYYKANIAADWEPERRERGFKWLDDHGHSDVIGITVTMKFLRGEADMAKMLVEYLRRSPWGNTHPPSVEMGTPWNTLTALVRELVESGQPVDLEALGATVGRMAKIVKRKGK